MPCPAPFMRRALSVFMCNKVEKASNHLPVSIYHLSSASLQVDTAGVLYCTLCHSRVSSCVCEPPEASSMAQDLYR